MIECLKFHEGEPPPMEMLNRIIPIIFSDTNSLIAVLIAFVSLFVAVINLFSNNNVSPIAKNRVRYFFRLLFVVSAVFSIINISLAYRRIWDKVPDVRGKPPIDAQNKLNDEGFLSIGLVANASVDASYEYNLIYRMTTVDDDLIDQNKDYDKSKYIKLYYYTSPISTVPPTPTVDLIPFLPDPLWVKSVNPNAKIRYPVYYAPSQDAFKSQTQNNNQGYTLDQGISVFACDEGWYMIEHAININVKKGSPLAYRIGYIENFPPQPNVPTLKVDGRTVYTNQKCALTDDPNHLRKVIANIEKGEALKLICQYENNSERWFYIETSINQKRVRGFVPASYIDVPKFK